VEWDIAGREVATGYALEFAGRARLTTWLFQITYRTIGAQLRRERKKRTLHALLRWLQPNAPAEPLESVVRAEEIIAVRRALEALPLKHRTVLVLFELESWSCADIAEALSRPLDTVYSRWHHARQKLAHKVALALEGRR
jgi:RNA polymerase sigma-70 factor (ECF subfamily)